MADLNPIRREGPTAEEVEAQALPTRDPELGPLGGRKQREAGLAERRRLYAPKDERTNLYPPEEEEQESVAPGIASDRAMQDVIALDVDDEFNQRTEQHIELGNVETQAAASVREMALAQKLDTSGIDFTNPDQIKELALMIDWESQTSRGLHLVYALYQGSGDFTNQEFESAMGRMPIDSARMIKEQLLHQSQAAFWGDWKDFMDSQSFAPAPKGQEGKISLDHLRSIAGQEIIPIFNQITRAQVLLPILDMLGMDRPEQFYEKRPSVLKQIIRDKMVSLPQHERLAMAQQILKHLQKAGNHPVYGYVVTRANLIEQATAILTPGVLSGIDAKNNLDFFSGAIFEAFDTVVGAYIVAGLGFKALRGMAAGRSTPQAFYMAAGSSREYPLGKIWETLQNDVVAARFGLEADELIPAILPKPRPFVDDIVSAPDGVAQQYLRSERQASELLESTDKLTGRSLTSVDKKARIQRELDELELADGHAVMPKMSTVEILPNDTGYRMTNIIGQTGEGGWRTIDEMLKDITHWVDDDTIKTFDIVRVQKDGTLKSVFKDSDEMIQAIFMGSRPAGTLGTTPWNSDFYLRYEQERFWHPADKLALDPKHMNNAVPATGRGWTIPPNVVFGEKFYGDFLDASLFEQQLNRQFNAMLDPYYKLGVADTKFVNSAFEWAESFGKDYGRAPTMIEINAHYGNITPKQQVGVVALREAMDTLHSVLDRRLYREFNARGFQTARSTNSELASYHGKVLAETEIKPGMYYDPNLEGSVSLTKVEIQELYRDGGKVMELDMPIQVPGRNTEKYTRLIIRDSYEIGELSLNPLHYTPGYTFRFPADPYYVIKKQSGVTINGKPAVGAMGVNEEAVWLASTLQEGNRKIARIKPVPGVEWEVRRGKDIQVTESTLFQKQVLNREGRMFWDNRADTVLPNVNGSTAQLEDPIKSMERGIGLAARQSTHEDLLKSYKGAFESTYQDIVQPGIFRTNTLDEIASKLGRDAKNTTDVVKKRRILDAKEIIEYFRLVEGTESAAIPFLREKTLSIATGLTRMADGILPWQVNGSRALEKYLMQMDPFRTMTSIAFKAFMVLRPARQALMQSAQIGYLAPLAPVYVGTGAIFRDAIGLRAGLTALLKSGYEPLLSNAKMAKFMGLSQKEYRHLIKQFNRSGIVDIVSAHSFAGGSTKMNKIKLPDSPVGMIGYRGKQAGTAVMNWAQKWGFDFGEKNNLTFTWGLALNQHMQAKGYKSLLQLSDAEWQQVTRTASNLGLGMVRANNLKYQSGALKVGTQFLSFSHKAALGMMALNPNINGKQALAIVAGTLILYGGNQFGAKDWVAQQLTNMGVSDQPIPGTKITLVDLISAGVIDSSYNAIMDLTNDERKALDLSFLAPGIDLQRLYESQITLIASQPQKAAFGPFGSLVSKVLMGQSFADWVMRGAPDMPEVDKFVMTADAMLTGAIPQYSNGVQVYLGAKMSRQFSSMNEPKPFRPTWEALIAKGLFGVQTKEEIAYYALQQAVYDSNDEVDGIIRENKDHFKRLIQRWRDGAMTAEDVMLNVQMISNLWEDFPEARRMEILQRSLIEPFNNGQPSIAKILSEWMAEGSIGPQHEALIDQLVELTPEQRENLKSLLRDTHERRLDEDKQAHELTKENR